MKRKQVIKKLRNGDVQIFNDLLPSTKEIKKLLKDAFPEDKYDGEGAYKYKYFKIYEKDKECWTNSEYTFDNLPIVKLSSITKNKLNKKVSELAKEVAELKQLLNVPSKTENEFENARPILEVGKWAEIIEETPIKEEDVIDWNVPQVVISDNGIKVITNGKNIEDTFEGHCCLYGNKILKLNTTYKKSCFNRFKGTLTINQE